MNEQTQIIKSLTREEQNLLCFFRPVGYHARLQQYLQYPEAFTGETKIPKSTVRLSTTNTFRRYLRRFIRTFQPEKLLTNNDLWLHLEGNGRFSVRHIPPECTCIYCHLHCLCQRQDQHSIKCNDPGLTILAAPAGL